MSLRFLKGGQAGVLYSISLFNVRINQSMSLFHFYILLLLLDNFADNFATKLRCPTSGTGAYIYTVGLHWAGNGLVMDQAKDYVKAGLYIYSYIITVKDI